MQYTPFLKPRELHTVTPCVPRPTYSPKACHPPLLSSPHCAPHLGRKEERKEEEQPAVASKISITFANSVGSPGSPAPPCPAPLHPAPPSPASSGPPRIPRGHIRIHWRVGKKPKRGEKKPLRLRGVLSALFISVTIYIPAHIPYDYVMNGERRDVNLTRTPTSLHSKLPAAGKKTDNSLLPGIMNC